MGAVGGKLRDVHVGFVMEQAMGHATHHRALATEVARDPTVRATWMPVNYRDQDLWQRMPGLRSNMSLLLSLRGRRAVRAQQREAGPFDALFFHTQLTALLLPGLMRTIPSIISIDATPLNADPHLPAVANGFARRPNGEGPWDRFKFKWYRRAFSRAAAIVSWSDWARKSLIADYQINPEKVLVIPPGVDLDFWNPGSRDDNGPDHKPRILFVGVDFDRKGGEILLEVFARLAGDARLDVVSPEAPSLAPHTRDVHVHSNLTINSHALRELYARADLFVLPTLNDCTPLAVLEAMASGLPVIASDVGAIREQVEHGVTGLLVRPGDPAGFAGAVQAMMKDGARRLAMGAAGRERAERLFSAARNYSSVLELVKRCALGPQRAASASVTGDQTLSPAPDAAASAGLGVPTSGRAWVSEQ